MHERLNTSAARREVVGDNQDLLRHTDGYLTDRRQAWSVNCHPGTHSAVASPSRSHTATRSGQSPHDSRSSLARCADAAGMFLRPDGAVEVRQVPAGQRDFLHVLAGNRRVYNVAAAHIYADVRVAGEAENVA